ncbi:MAG: DUF2171 domain-containing protein [Alphaproteobacteria bacterium]|nr:DUF2171 domain-containing protein [Alphaproteobacteria bacterium]
MIEPLGIKDHMHVVDHDGHSLGMINGVIDDPILLVRSSAGALHHCVPPQRVAEVDETRIRLK